MNLLTFLFLTVSLIYVLISINWCLHFRVKVGFKPSDQRIIKNVTTEPANSVKMACHCLSLGTNDHIARTGVCNIIHLKIKFKLVHKIGYYKTNFNYTRNNKHISIHSKKIYIIHQIFLRRKVYYLNFLK